MGTASGGFVFRKRDSPVRDVSLLGVAQLRDAGYVAVSHASETGVFSVACGRGTRGCISEACLAARRAAAGGRQSEFSLQSVAAALLKRVCTGSR